MAKPTDPPEPLPFYTPSGMSCLELCDHLMAQIAVIRDDGNVKLSPRYRQRIDALVKRYNNHLDKRASRPQR